MTRQQVTLERGDCSVRLEPTAAELQNGKIEIGVPVPKKARSGILSMIPREGMHAANKLVTRLAQS